MVAPSNKRVPTASERAAAKKLSVDTITDAVANKLVTGQWCDG